MPDVYLLRGARIADFSGLASAGQALALAGEELKGLDPSTIVIILTVAKLA